MWEGAVNLCALGEKFNAVYAAWRSFATAEDTTSISNMDCG